MQAADVRWPSDPGDSALFRFVFVPCAFPSELSNAVMASLSRVASSVRYANGCITFPPSFPPSLFFPP